MKNAMTVRLLILCILAYVITDNFVADVANAIGPSIFNAVHPSNAVLFSAQIHAVVFGVMLVVVWYLMSKVYDAFKKPRDWRHRSDDGKQESQAQEQSTKTSWAGMTKSILAFVGTFAIGFALGKLPIDTDWYSCVLNHTKVGTEAEGYVVRAYCAQGNQWWHPKQAAPVIDQRSPDLPGPVRPKAAPSSFIPDPPDDRTPIPVLRKGSR
jgi:hypothetical protein